MYETDDNSSDHDDHNSVDDRIHAVKKRPDPYDVNMGSVVPTTRYDEFKRISRSRRKPKDYLELWMARAVLIVFVFTLIYHLLTGVSIK